MSRSRRVVGGRWLLGLLSLSLGPPAAGAVSVAPRTAQIVEVGAYPVSVALTEGTGSAVAITAECVIPRPPQVVWSVLADYNHLAEFVPFVTSSRIISQDATALLLRQEGQAGLLGFSRRFAVTFRVREHPFSEIRFESVAGDFTHFNGRWHLERRPEGTLVRHEVELQPAFAMPKWIMRLVERYVLLSSMKAVIRRCLQAPLPAPGGPP